MDAIRILIADDHPVFWFGLRALLSAMADTEVVGEVTLAVRNVPSAPRPSRSENDLELALFDELIDELGRTLTHSAMAVLE